MINKALVQTLKITKRINKQCLFSFSKKAEQEMEKIRQVNLHDTKAPMEDKTLWEKSKDYVKETVLGEKPHTLDSTKEPIPDLSKRGQGMWDQSANRAYERNENKKI